MNDKISTRTNNNQKMPNKTKAIIFAVTIVLVATLGYLAISFFGKGNNGDGLDKTAELEKYLKENYSKYVIDGSTSLIPLHEALEEKFGDGKEIKHSKTVAAFEDFLDGKTDILLSVDYLDSYFEKAKEKDVGINKNAISKEALVFLKNVDLKIDSLTIDQIRQIYDKKVTDWRQIDSNYVGYNTTDILPIYRNEDSGSGMALINLLGRNNINCSKEDCIFINDMGAVVNALAFGLEEGFGGAMIAFNMYTFTEKQYQNDRVTTFKIEGVEPNDETIYNDEYPIILYNYIYYKDDDAQEFGEKLYEYLISDAGQKLLMENGYVPLRKQDDAQVADVKRNCKTNFVEEICVKNRGYNEDIDKYVKITVDNKSEKFEYFDRVEDYIFANSNLNRDEFESLIGILSELISEAEKQKQETENITLAKQKDGKIIVDTGFCGGAACIWLEPKEEYAFNGHTPKEGGHYGLTSSFIISEDLNTITLRIYVEFEQGYEHEGNYDFNVTIPIQDFTKALKVLGWD